LERKLNICIVQPNANVYSETFILNHVERLPANVFNTYGPWWPEFDGSNKRLTETYQRRSFKSILLHYACRVLPFFLFNRLPATISSWPLNTENLHEAAFRYYLQKNNIDIVLAEYGVKGAVVYKLCSQMKIPLIIHFHGYDAHHTPTLQLYKEDYQNMFVSSAALVVVSKWMRQKLISLGAPEQKIHLNYYGIDISLFTACNPSLNPPHFISVGRFVDKKSPHLTILAFKQVASYYPESKLYFIGDGILLESCKNLSISLGLDKQVFFEGIQSPGQVANRLGHCRAFVLHSLVTTDGDTEGTPNAVMEAMATGLPVISTRHAGIRDIITDGVQGFLVEERNIDAMAQKMIQLIADPKRAREMGVNSRIFAENNLSLKQSTNSLYAIIQESLKKGNV
jgi:colanic acid/amylovoran biosynthesis glycosyltransferase